VPITKRTLKEADPLSRKPKVAYLVRVEGRRDPVTGARKRFSRQVATIQEARKLERSWQVEIERGTAVDPAKTTVAELLDAWLATKAGEITGQSHKDYEIIVRRHLKPALGTIRVQELTTARVQAQYAAWADAGMSARMIRGCHMRLSQALRQAVRFGIVATNACDATSPPRLSGSKADVWNADEASRFLRESGTDWLHPLWHLLLLEGMRRGEALGLRWRDLNWERGTVHLSQTVAPDKSNRGAAMIQRRTKTTTGARTVKLSPDTLEALREHRPRWLERKLAAVTWADHDLIVCTGLGTPINPNNVSRSFEALVKRAGLRRIRVHDLRHTSATLLLLAGTPAKVVSERLGHASIGITFDLYSHVLPAMQDDAALAISRILAGARTGAS